MTKVFISYSRKDLDFVEKLASDIEDADVSAWYDLSRLQGGDRWAKELQDAIDSCDAFILVISSDSIKSDWVFKEFLYASSNKKKVIPLLYKQCKLPLWLQDIQFIDIQGEHYQKNFQQILRALGIKKELTPPEPFTERRALKPEYLVSIIAIIVVIIGATIGPSITDKLIPEPTSTITVTPSPTSTPPPAPTNTQIPTATFTQTIMPTETTTPTPTPSPTATPDPFADGFELVTMDETVYRGGEASATIRTTPNTYCTLTFFLPSGTMSNAAGVGACTTNKDGLCTWTWDIRSNVNPGYANIVIIVNEQQESFPIEIR